MNIFVKDKRGDLQEKMKRIREIDVLRGYATVLVVVGHIIQYVIAAPNEFDNSIVFRFIYSFHMPLFFFISGFCIYRSNKTYGWKWIIAKGKQLVIPFCVWIPIGWVIHKSWNTVSLLECIKRVIVSPDNGGLWFLWVLFLCDIGWTIIAWIIPKDYGLKVLVSTIFMMYLVVTKLLPSVSYFGIGLLKYRILYYLLGIIAGYIYDNKDKYQKFKKIIDSKIVILLITVLFVLSAYYWDRINGYKLQGIVCWINDRTPYGTKFLNLYFKNIVSVLGILASCYLSRILIMNAIVEKIFSYIGTFSLEIYILQFYFLRNWIGVIGIDAVLSFLMCIGLSILISRIIEKKRLLGSVLFGKLK